MRVMHVVVAGDLGGAERFLVDLAARGSQAGAEHAIALFTPNEQLRELFGCFRVFDAGAVREHAGSFLRRTFGRSSLAFVAASARDFGASCIHMHTLGSHVLGVRAALQLGIPSVRTEHHVVHYTDASARAFTDWAARRTARIACVSQYVCNWLLRARPALRAQLSTIRNGVDETRFALLPPAPPSNKVRLAMACRLVRWKRVDWALRALALLPSHVTLVVAGEGPERARLEALAADLGLGERARLLGYRAQVQEVYADADFVLSASESEPLGLSVLEGLACGRPVIGFAAGGIPELVEDDVRGVLASAESVAGLAGAIRRAAEFRPAARATMSAECRRFVEHEGSADRMARAYGALYAQVAREPAGDRTALGGSC